MFIDIVALNGATNDKDDTPESAAIELPVGVDFVVNIDKNKIKGAYTNFVIKMKYRCVP